MFKQTSAWGRMVELIVAGKFEPVEALLAGSAIIHGLWLLFPGWNIMSFPTTITTTPRVVEVLFAVFMVLGGSSVLVAMRERFRRKNNWRRVADMSLFIGWLFASVLSFIATGTIGVLWIAYLTIAAVAAIVYLNISVGVWDNGIE